MCVKVVPIFKTKFNIKKKKKQQNKTKTHTDLHKSPVLVLRKPIPFPCFQRFANLRYLQD